MALLLLAGCATHPTVSTERMAKGESQYGYTLSVENVFPFIWYRYALSDKSDVGFRVGLPIYGSGIDYSRLLYSKEDKWDVLNVAWSVNPNYNLDFTYYKFRQRKAKKTRPASTTWWGIRMMYIPKGMSGGRSNRLGLLLGGQPNQRFGYELGYYHDFNSMPITELFNFKWKTDMDQTTKARYGDTPHTAYGLPSEYSRLTGISVRVFINLGSNKQKPSQVEEESIPPEKQG